MMSEGWEALLEEALGAATMPRWRKDKVKLLERRIMLAQRYDARDTHALICKVLRQAAHYGIDYVLSSISPESRKVYLRARSVIREMRRKVAEKNDELWEVYYDACFIDERRNRRLSLQRMPKKYWKGLDKLEKEKIKRGIQKKKLEEWIQQ